jgi:hypothetical protein
MAFPGPSPLVRTVVPGSWSEIYRAIRELDENYVYVEPPIYIAPAPAPAQETATETAELTFEEIVRAFNETLIILNATPVRIDALDL